MSAGAANRERGRLPARIGPYPIIKRIGAGGFGEVFLAHHVTPDRRPVVVKRARPERATNERFAELFVQEARVVSRLAHENIVPVIDAGQDDNGLPYLVMEYVRGPSLAQLLQTMPGRQLPAELVAHVVLAVARALAHTHGSAVIHRDVKPQNVFIDASGRVFLGDFGIARVQRAGPYEATLTATEAGTESYMPPEMLGAQTPLLSIDHRVDLWALGVLAWECLCGWRPFEDEALGARPDLDAGRWARINLLCTPPRRRSLDDVIPDAPRALRDVIEGLLQPIERRFATADVVVRQLVDAGFGHVGHQTALAELVSRDTAPSGSGIRPSMPGARSEEPPMNEPPAVDVESPTARLSPERPALGEGSRIHHYTILRELGRGGMGATFVAVRPDIDKRVCLKVMLPELADNAQFREDFFKEARVAAQLSHPNVVSLIDFGELPDGLLWAAFELVDGVDLADLAKKTGGALPPDYVALIISDVAQALLHMHTGDHRRPPIVHRDVSRKNVVVSFEGVVKLIDLGIAKVMHGAETRNDVAGKIAYMAPEVLRLEPPKPAVDQWALGVVLYSMLTGRAPYAGAYDGSKPPALVSPHGQLDPLWNRIVSRLLEPDANRRYPSLAEMIDELAPLVPPHAMRRQLGHLLRLRAPTKSMPERQGVELPAEVPIVPPRPTIDVNDLGPGSRFGEWEIERKLGTGGMAVVFLATRARAVGGSQQAALKLIRPEHAASGDFVTRFESEVAIAMRLKNQNIVTVLDAGRVHGVYFMAMEYIEGCDLDTLVEGLTKRGVLSQRRLPAELVLFVGAGLLHALEYAHRNGVVHRDVSPHNVMVTVAGEVKLNDFGVAKSMKADGMASKTAHAVGKPHYMPPEQFRGDPLDGRADLFAAGVSFYEMLAGTSPYAMRGTPNETFHMVVKRVFENDRPHTAEVAPHAPPELVEVIEALLQPNRDHRPRRAEDVLVRLEPLVQLRCKRMLGELVRAAGSEQAVPISASVLEAVRIPFAPPTPHAPKGGGTLEPPAPAEPSARPTSAPALPAAGASRYLFVALGALALIALALVAFGAVMFWPDSPGRTEPTPAVPVVAAPEQSEPAAQPASADDEARRDERLADPAPPVGTPEQPARPEENVAQAPGEPPASSSAQPERAEPQVAERARPDQSTRSQRHRPPELRPVAQPTTLSPTTNTSPVNRPRESQPGRGAFGL